MGMSAMACSEAPVVNETTSVKKALKTSTVKNEVENEMASDLKEISTKDEVKVENAETPILELKLEEETNSPGTPPPPPAPVMQKEEPQPVFDDTSEFEDIIEEIPAPGISHAIMHQMWNELLQKHVSTEGVVNYKGMKKDYQALKNYTELLSKEGAEIKNATINEQKAFWSNAYNAFTVLLIVDNYPLKSITDLKFDGKSAWDYVWIKIGEKNLSLNDIENKILRPTYNDPRIHFVINCASFSCPILVNQALTGKNIESILEKQAIAFVNDTKRNKISEKKAEVSNLFEWYAKDFGDLVEFLNKYSKVKINKGVQPTYMKYDWSLNE